MSIKQQYPRDHLDVVRPNGGYWSVKDSDHSHKPKFDLHDPRDREKNLGGWKAAALCALALLLGLLTFGCSGPAADSAQADVSTRVLSSAERLQEAAERSAAHVETVLDVDLGEWAVKFGDAAKAASVDDDGRGVEEIQQAPGMTVLAFTRGAIIVVDPRLAESRWHSTLVHEMVHIAQYRHIGMSLHEKGQEHQRRMEARYGDQLPFAEVWRAFNVLGEAQAYHVAYEMDGVMPPMAHFNDGLLLTVMGEVRRLGHERIFEILNSDQFLTDLQEVKVD